MVSRMHVMAHEVSTWVLVAIADSETRKVRDFCRAQLRTEIFLTGH